MPRRKFASKEEAAEARKAYLKEYNKSYQRPDEDALRARSRAAYFDNPEPARERENSLYRSDPAFRARKIEAARRWRKDNPERVLAYREEARINRLMGRIVKAKAVSTGT
ncbi:hypothetical protein ASD12_18590 [Mesorhizobium sp. Root102]|uniref:hypothetical protein n=1 Tax=Mesorhizobium sp. Root102 TaxID=1736422 RepID=UPI0006F7E67F|nr:hypothetical protein [Mesorhizobium sp. Root102]KQU99777.1 hypothetical protein ASD12_18590 [Mesorhizobium sp. Root102]